MDNQMLEVLPEHLRGFYETKTINPNSLATKFKTLNKAEQVKENIRNTSNLYKVFGENLFLFTTIDGGLNLDIRLFNPIELIKDIRDERRLLLDREGIVHGANFDYGKKQYPEVEAIVGGKEHPVSFDYIKWVEQIHSDYKDLAEAQRRLMNVPGVGEVVNEETLLAEPAMVNGQTLVYMKKDLREDVDGITKLLRSIQNSTISAHNLFYFRYSIKSNELHKAMRNINWRYELRVL